MPELKTCARIGAAVLAGLAVGLALVDAREQAPEPAIPSPRPWVPDGDPLALQLRACAEMGELALSAEGCHQAWAEKRRRFFGVEHPHAYTGMDRLLPPGEVTPGPSGAE